MKKDTKIMAIISAALLTGAGIVTSAVILEPGPYKPQDDPMNRIKTINQRYFNNDNVPDLDIRYDNGSQDIFYGRESGESLSYTKQITE